ncbi:MAG: hypothetical protein GY953_15615, partial [bacterium]|nr:hypothetical protein [bacterium]
MRAYSVCLFVFLAGYPAFAQESFLIRFGTERTWNGSASVTAGRIADLRPWQFDEADAIFGKNRWEITTKPDTYWHSPWERSLLGTKRQTKLTERGVLLTVEMTGPGAVSIETAQGNFEFTPASIPWEAPKTFLDGAVTVSRAPQPNRARIPGAQDYVTSLPAR